jgi:hypothetical protein
MSLNIRIGLFFYLKLCQMIDIVEDVRNRPAEDFFIAGRHRVFQSGGRFRYLSPLAI